MVVWQTAEVTENQILGHKFRVVKFKVVSDPAWTFAAGQFILMRMGRAEKVNSYSPSNIPDRGKMEIIMDITPADFEPPAGEGSRFIRGLVPGDKVEFTGPSGKFVVKDDGADKLWFVATGSGISSLWSMMRDQLEKQGDNRPIKLWWGMRHDEEMVWQEELTDLKSKYKNFSYAHVLSQPSENWMGPRGHVTEHVLAEIGNLAEEELREVSVYLCGNDHMIKQVSSGLFALGVPKDRVYWEKYF